MECCACVNKTTTRETTNLLSALSMNSDEVISRDMSDRHEETYHDDASFEEHILRKTEERSIVYKSEFTKSEEDLGLGTHSTHRRCLSMAECLESAKTKTLSNPFAPNYCWILSTLLGL